MQDCLVDMIFEPYRDGPHFRLQTFDLNARDHFHKWRLRYRLFLYENGRDYLLFHGDDFSVSPMHGLDSDETILALMNFLCLKPGDTDAEYFEEYTPEQLEFADEHGEALMFAVENWVAERKET